MNSNDQVAHLKETAPYINVHRGKSMVIHLCVQSFESQLHSIVHEISVLYSLDIKLIIIFGSDITNDAPINEADLPRILAKIGALRIQLESRLSMGLIHSPMQGAHIKVCSGNMVIAKPKGIIEGTDYGHNGLVRKIRQDFLLALMEGGAITVIAPIGYSPSGEVFCVDSIHLSQLVATSIDAYKLIYLNKGPLTKEGASEPLREWTPRDTEEIELIAKDSRHLARSAFEAVRNGVDRVHVLDYQADNALLQELFTRDGSGTLVGIKSYETLRIANTDDVAGILGLIQPLEQAGVLVRRSRELIESEIAQYSVIERDGVIIGCAALHTFFEEKIAEAACIAIHPEYQNKGRGETLLENIEQRAQTLGLSQIFVLTTQTTHWFVEQGYAQQTLEHLPLKKQSLYNYQRGSKILVKALN